MTTPQGHPCPAWDDLIAAFHDHWILSDYTWQAIRQKTLGIATGAASAPACWSSGTPFANVGTISGCTAVTPGPRPAHLSHTCHLCGECNTVSCATPTGTNRCAQCCQVAVCCWPEQPAGLRRRTEEGALQRRIEGAQTPWQGQARPASALLWIHVHLRDPTSVAHPSHVFAP